MGRPFAPHRAHFHTHPRDSTARPQDGQPLTALPRSAHGAPTYGARTSHCSRGRRGTATLPAWFPMPQGEGHAPDTTGTRSRRHSNTAKLPPLPPAHRPPARSRRRPGGEPSLPALPSALLPPRPPPGHPGNSGPAGLSPLFALGFPSKRGRHGSVSAARTLPADRHARGAGGGDRTLPALAVYGNAELPGLGLFLELRGSYESLDITAFGWLLLPRS